MSEIKEIKVCDCGAPILWTFLFDGAEYFCMSCGATGGMFGTGKNVLVTTERRAEYKVAHDVFKALRKHLHGSGNFSRSGCKKCSESSGYNHLAHATKYELHKNKVAVAMLNKLAGYYKKL